MPATTALELPFDAYQRYRLVADLVGRFPRAGANAEPLRVLDVGGRTGLMRAFLPDARVDLVDVDPSDEPGLVIGCGGALPFRDGAFDVVTACDTLEHVPPAARERFLAECARVSRGWVVLAGPYDAPEVREAEEGLRAFLKRKLALDHRYLNEHAEHGLPGRAATEEALRVAGCEVTSVGHASLARWLPLMCLEMYLDSDPHLREVAKRYFRVYNETLYASDHAGPVYRHAVVAVKPGVPLPSTIGLFEESVAPPQAVARFGELFGELVAFDRERDVYEAERDRLRAVNDGLVVDLEGHRETLRALRADLAQHAASLAERGRLLDAERTERSSLERALRREHGECAKQRNLRTEAQAHAESLEADLRGHRETLAAVRDELDGLRDEHQRALARSRADLEEHRAVIDELRGEVDGHRGVNAELRRDLDDHRAVLAELRAETEARRAEQLRLETALHEALDALRARDVELDAERARNAELEETNAHLHSDLADRWKNFRRAFELRRDA